MIDETRQLRWYLGLGLVFLAVAPLLMMTLVASDEAAPDGASTPLFVAGPVNVVGLVFVVRSMLASRAGKHSGHSRGVMVSVGLSNGLQPVRRWSVRCGLILACRRWRICLVKS